MQAQRVLGRVDHGTLLIQLPESFNHRRVEVIVLALDEENAVPETRQPHPDLAGSVRIHGDIFASAPEQDWDLPQ
ncbi:hypothetical protein [Thiorhodovibrio frisius]|uniref:Uncharacterized protein n=1 Tax=Thiorhodovibrio frisius TaxID=631362 RepID=H8Z2K6_9GAMM|nr:hypothetical protein [Thiorhodovibrio frisius]EIC22699.1 hypothetical protein Thi970DRAFT_02977 [Thiorhodovibrio frisius]WPL22455.1 hypothetical protein Thiofri_02619 [Thiorhodovibrio frisius]